MANAADRTFFLVRSLQRLLGRWLTIKASVLGKRFYCRALAGESNYNICINSDLSVSCNCQDFDGSGHIGSLKEQTMAEIFEGDTASRFRRTLASGRLPLATCSRWYELRMVAPKEAKRKVTEFTLPQNGIMIENTVICNLKCLSCTRSVVKQRIQYSMSLEDVRRIAIVIKEMGTRQIYFFNLG